MQLMFSSTKISIEQSVVGHCELCYYSFGSSTVGSLGSSTVGSLGSYAVPFSLSTHKVEHGSSTILGTEAMHNMGEIFVQFECTFKVHLS